MTRTRRYTSSPTAASNSASVMGRCRPRAMTMVMSLSFMPAADNSFSTGGNRALRGAGAGQVAGDDDYLLSRLVLYPAVEACQWDGPMPLAAMRPRAGSLHLCALLWNRMFARYGSGHLSTQRTRVRRATLPWSRPLSQSPIPDLLSHRWAARRRASTTGSVCPERKRTMPPPEVQT